MRRGTRLLAGLFVMGLCVAGLGPQTAAEQKTAAEVSQLPADEGYPLPADKAGTLLAKVLPPRDLPLLARETTAGQPAREAFAPALPVPAGNSPLPVVPATRQSVKLVPRLVTVEPVPGAVGGVPLPGV